MKIETLFVVVFFFLLTTLITMITAGTGFRPPSNDTDFIRTSCKTTSYPELCFTSLSSYSSVVQQDPGRLARVAISITLSKANKMAKYVSNMSVVYDATGANPQIGDAIHDCTTLFGDVVDDISRSLRQMRRLNGSGETLRFQLSNVQTWMSAALTSEETCTDGFEDVPDNGVKADVCNRAVKVKEVTSIALALVNSFVNTLRIS